MQNVVSPWRPLCFQSAAVQAYDLVWFKDSCFGNIPISLHQSLRPRTLWTSTSTISQWNVSSTPFKGTCQNGQRSQLSTVWKWRNCDDVVCSLFRYIHAPDSKYLKRWTVSHAEGRQSSSKLTLIYGFQILSSFTFKLATQHAQHSPLHHSPAKVCQSDREDLPLQRLRGVQDCRWCCRNIIPEV